MNCNNNKYALITGASKGLGKALAMELASRKINVLLVALMGEGLPELSACIKNQYGVKAEYLEIDLLDSFAEHKVVHWVGEKNVYILINNAGIGGSIYFESASCQYLDRIIQINIRVLSLLTYLILPNLKRQHRAYILNVSSMASFSPIAFKTVYPASKSFVYSFSRCLNEELKTTQVSVCVLHPGPMETNPEVCERIASQGPVARMALQTPEEVATIAVRGLIKNRTIIIPGLMNKIHWLLMKIIPTKIKVPLISRIVRRELMLHTK